MTLDDLLKEIHEKDIDISFVNGKLTYAGPEQYITEEFLGNLKTNKGKLIKHFWPLKDSNMIPINPEGNKTPFILVHGEQSNYFVNDSLQGEHPFYGFLHPGSAGEPVKYGSVEKFASEYIKQLLIVAPNGPYMIGGFSFGGIIAFEMACQLRKMGHEILMLLIVDVISPYYKGKYYKKDFYSKLKRHILHPVKIALEKSIKMFIANSYILFKKPVPLFLRNFYILTNYIRAYSKYKPSKLNMDIVLFRSSQNECNDWTLGWDRLIDGKIDVFEFVGNHLDIINKPENARKFASIVRQKIEELQNIK